MSRTTKYRWGVVAVIVLMPLLAGCPNPQGGSSRPGDPAVYESIDAQTSCRALRRLFEKYDAAHQSDVDRGRGDLAEIHSAYLFAVTDRQSELGCD